MGTGQETAPEPVAETVPCVTSVVNRATSPNVALLLDVVAVVLAEAGLGRRMATVAEVGAPHAMVEAPLAATAGVPLVVTAGVPRVVTAGLPRVVVSEAPHVTTAEVRPVEVRQGLAVPPPAVHQVHREATHPLAEVRIGEGGLAAHQGVRTRLVDDRSGSVQPRYCTPPTTSPLSLPPCIIVVN